MPVSDAVIVDALDEQARQFYQHYGFQCYPRAIISPVSQYAGNCQITLVVRAMAVMCSRRHAVSSLSRIANHRASRMIISLYNEGSSFYQSKAKR